MKSIKERIVLLVFLLSFIVGVSFVVSCTDSTSPETGQGEFKLTMVDAPAGYDQVNIVVTRVEIHKTDAEENSGWFVINNIETTYDLLTLRNGASAVLGDTMLDAGQYSQIRLLIGSGSNVVVDGITHSLDIPSGEQSGIKLNHSFEIKSESLYELILDFDAGRSIVLTGNGQYKLKPVIRLIPMVISGTISGTIDPAFAAGYVYAINGTDTAGTIADPLAGSFKLMALLEQSYRVEVLSASPDYNDTTLTNIVVNKNQNTDLGLIILSEK
ncbi:MAG: DUF4382 domain-containing protein [Melioribacteraceae bacterium]|nr:DUF4382 domain-containing protein [Melioribacteraceae bacterium]